MNNNMADYFHRDRLREIWMQIEQLHLSYLQTDENAYKIEQRSKLENYIREYLCLVPHDRKFCFRETADVLHRSASTKDDFNGYRAASAWNAIGMYAANLLSQPWRKEYREMKMYSGFYKHEIEANLVGAELMLEAMGYKHIGQTTMILDGPIDPDRVSNVSRDSLVAAVECQLLKSIWEEVSRRFDCGWLEVLEFRENHVGTPESAARGLVFKFNERQYQAAYHPGPALDNFGTAARFHQPGPSCLYGQIPPLAVPHMGYYNYSPYAMGPPHAYTLPAQPRYGPLMSPQQALPPNMSYPIPAPVHTSYHLPASVHPVLKSQDLYTTNGHNAPHTYQTPLGVAPPVQGMQMAMQNGYTAPNQMAPAPTTIQNYNCPVPTGQLIELDAAPPPQSSSTETQQGFSATDSSSSVLIPRTVRQHQGHQTNKINTEKHHEAYNRNPSSIETQQTRNFVPDIGRSNAQQQSPLSKAREDGTGTFDSWDYVYRNLESQGYSKDLGERPDILSPPHDNINNIHRISTQDNRNVRQQQTGSLDLEDTLMELRLEEYQRKMLPNPPENRTLKINEALQKIRLEGDGEVSRVLPIRSSNGGVLAVDGSVSVYDNMSSPPKETSARERPLTVITGSTKPISVPAKATTKTLPREPRRHAGDSKKSLQTTQYSSATLDPRQLTDRVNHYVPPMTNASESSVNDKPTRRESSNKIRSSEKPAEKNDIDEDVLVLKVNGQGRWECVTCTFLNVQAHDVCEMCGKSKTRGSETRPLASGGRECPQCTLVNEKGVDTCSACDSSLKNSPTYI